MYCHISVRHVIRCLTSSKTSTMLRQIILFSILFCCFILKDVGAKKRFYETHYLDVPLDHYTFNGNKTFKLRYLINNTFWDEMNGPILFYTGNEGTIELFAEHTGFIWNIAPDMKALIVFAEHRYYGKSMPFGNESLTPQNIGYLTTSQAIADYVDLITFLLKDKAPQDRNPVFAIGGSYGGMLAAYIRMKYPHIVNGAIAASAPILQFQDLTPCDVFYRIISSVFKANDDSCFNSIKKSWPVLKDTLNTDEGRKWISNQFNLCKPLTDNKDNFMIFKEWLKDIFTNLAMMNYPYSNDFLAPLPGYPVFKTCQHLQNETLTNKPLLQAISKAVSVFTNYTGKTKCNDLLNPDLNGIDDKAWDYQSCTEMVMPMCTTGVYDMFENEPFDKEAFSSQCKKKWLIEPSYKLPIIEYGGKNLKYFSNIIFSNGLLDPWASGGVLRNFSDSIVAVIIPEGAHHLDLMDDNENDPDSVIQARSFHKNTLTKWINDFYGYD